ncbi:unnamed protein product, partial [Polarella glacialis]
MPESHSNQSPSAAEKKSQLRYYSSPSMRPEEPPGTPKAAGCPWGPSSRGSPLELPASRQSRVLTPGSHSPSRRTNIFGVHPLDWATPPNSPMPKPVRQSSGSGYPTTPQKPQGEANIFGISPSPQLLIALKGTTPPPPPNIAAFLDADAAVADAVVASADALDASGPLATGLDNGLVLELNA